LPIDPSDPDVRALIGAYEALLAAVPLDEATVVAAHTALLEAASLLRWAPHMGPAEREYIRRRTRAIGNHADTLEVEQLAYLRAAIGRHQRH
jgi:hypothetical protein